jgi:hypothetical protein
MPQRADPPGHEPIERTQLAVLPLGTMTETDSDAHFSGEACALLSDKGRSAKADCKQAGENSNDRFHVMIIRGRTTKLSSPATGA